MFLAPLGGHIAHYAADDVLAWLKYRGIVLHGQYCITPLRMINAYVVHCEERDARDIITRLAADGVRAERTRERTVYIYCGDLP